MAQQSTAAAVATLGTNIPAAAKVRAPIKRHTTRIVLEENPDIPPNGLFVGINDKGYLIRAGDEVDVPDEVLEVLDNASGSVPVMDPSTQQVIGYRKKMRYPYRRITTRD